MQRTQFSVIKTCCRKILKHIECPKLIDSILKSPIDETIAEKIVKFCVVRNEDMRIYLS